MQVAIFEGTVELNEYAEQAGRLNIEDKVQQFLTGHPEITIHHINQSSASDGDSESITGYVTISIFYTEEYSDGH